MPIFIWAESLCAICDVEALVFAARFSWPGRDLVITGGDTNAPEVNDVLEEPLLYVEETVFGVWPLL